MKLKDIGRYFRDRQVSLARKSLVLFAAAYVVMPIDAIPDVIPIFGWLDDLGVVAAVTAFILRDVGRHAARLASPPAPK
jgi:uncharacterized membrane protein YkvA (DUF1232 family)